MPANNTVVQISKDGVPLLSYRPDPSRITSPSTMPWDVIRGLAASLGYGGCPLGLRSGTVETEQWPCHVFHQDGTVTLLVGKALSACSSTFVDAIEISLEWSAVSDYRN